MQLDTETILLYNIMLLSEHLKYEFKLRIKKQFSWAQDWLPPLFNFHSWTTCYMAILMLHTKEVPGSESDLIPDLMAFTSEWEKQ